MKLAAVGRQLDVALSTAALLSRTGQLAGGRPRERQLRRPFRHPQVARGLLA